MSLSVVEPPLVRHYVAGGSEHGGGIGRLVGYVRAAPERRHSHKLTDTRGVAWSARRSPLVLARAMLVMLGQRIVAPSCVHQLHIAGRGSTARKTLLGLWAQVLGARYVMHLHDYDYATDFGRRPAWQRAAVRRVFARASRVIVLGQRDRLTAERLLGVTPGRVSILRNCVPDPGPPQPAAGGDVHIVFLGQLGPRKGVPELLDALSGPALPATGWRATLAGNGAVDEVRRTVEACGLSDRIRVPGWLGLSETQALCASAQILVLPSHAEGFAMAVLEGLAHGLAVVTTRVGAHGEAMEHDRQCLFVPVGDARALGETLARLVGDGALRARLSAEARRLFLSEFAIGGYVARLERLLGDLGAGVVTEWKSA